MNKIKSQKEILYIVGQLKKKNKKIVTYNGSFDLLHAGHIRAIHEAKKQGDVLLLLLNSDISIKQYKGINRPINKEKERSEIISAIEDIDYVVIFNEINPITILNKIKPHIHCNGSDYGINCIERTVVESNGGKIHILQWQKGYSTTKLINRILETYSQPDIKAVFIDRDGTINFNKHGYIYKIDEFEFIPGTLKALRKLTDSDYKVIILTNQSGIGRKYYSQDDYIKLNNWLIDTLRKKAINIDKVYYCPHTDKNNCKCRKPNVGMLINAVKDLDINLNKSWIIGDDIRDIMMGRSANLNTIKIGAKLPANSHLEPHFYVNNLLEAAEIVLSGTS